MSRHLLILIFSTVTSALFTAVGFFHAAPSARLVEIIGPFLGFYAFASLRFGFVVPLGTFLGSGLMAALMGASISMAIAVAVFTGASAAVGEKIFKRIRIDHVSTNIGRNMSRQVTAAFFQSVFLVALYAVYIKTNKVSDEEIRYFDLPLQWVILGFHFFTFQLLPMPMLSLNRENFKIQKEPFAVVRSIAGIAAFLGIVFYFHKSQNHFGLIPISFFSLYVMTIFSSISVSILVVATVNLAILFAHRFGLQLVPYGSQSSIYLQSMSVVFCFNSLIMVMTEIRKGAVLKRTSLSLLVSLSLCSICFWYFNQREVESDKALLVQEIQEFQTHLKNRYAYYESALNAGKSYILSSGRPQPQVWQTFVEGMNIESRYPGINGVGVIYDVSNGDLKRFNESMKKTDPRYVYHEVPGKKENLQLERNYVISFIEPYLKNKAALGLDIASNVTRKNAADLARKTGAAAITKRIVLVQDNFKRPGFLMMVPFEMSDLKSHKSNAEVITSRGWVYAPFVMEKFVQPALEPIGDKLSVEIFEDNWEKGSSLFTKVFDEPGYHPMSTRQTERIGSVDWLVQYSSTSKLQNGVVQLSIVILCLFVIMTGTVAVVIASIHQVAVENKTLAQNLQAKFEEASQITVLGEMTAGIAHEINNPLSIIIGKTQILLSRLEKGRLDMDYLRESLTAIQRTSERTAKIIKGLKALSRRGEADPKATIDLSVIVENSLEISRERFKSHSIDLLVDPVPELTVRCREVQISQVLINLINNAHDAIRGTDNPWVRVSFSQQNDVIDILVLDSGSGIPKEIADKLMTPFFTTKPAGKGTGLGLSISKKIVQDHDGDLFVDHSKVNTCFVIRLPCSTKSALAA